MIITGDAGKLGIDILCRSHPDTDDYWDGNWLDSKITISVSGFNALYTTNLRVEELQAFYQGLISLQNGNLRDVEFTTIETGLYLHCQREINGTISCKGKAMHDTGNNLEFNFQTDLATIDVFVNDLKAVLKSYPLIGNL